MDDFVILTAKSNAEAVQQHRMLTNAMMKAYDVSLFLLAYRPLQV